jgi:uncharacterized membrane protein
MRIASVSHAVFAITMIGLGILGLIKVDFAIIWDPIPKALPALAYLCALISLACGIGLLFEIAHASSARVLLAYMLLWILLVRVPGMFRSFTVEFWWAACRTAVMAAAAWVLYVWFATDWDRQRAAFATGDSGLAIARALFGLGLIPLGIAHFLYLKDTASLVPSWIPWHLGCAFFTGCTFILAGVAVLLGVYASLAAVLMTLQLAVFTFVVWVPVVASGSKDAFQWSETIVSAAMTAGAWVVADSYRSRHVNQRSPHPHSPSTTASSS